MTTSPQTDWMNHPVIREIVNRSQTLTLAERVTLVKGLIPGIADQFTASEFEGFIEELRRKGQRFNEAKDHPGEGRAERQIRGEREVEQR